MVLLAEYLEEHKCQPEEKGHKRVIDPDDRLEYVLVPLQARKRVKRSSNIETVLTMKIADNSLDLNDSDLAGMQKSLLNSLAPPKATGQLMVSQAASASTHGSTAPLRSTHSGPPSTAPAPLPAPSIAGFGFGYTSPLPAALPKTETEATESAPAPVTKKGSRNGRAPKRKPAPSNASGTPATSAALLPAALRPGKTKKCAGAPKRDFIIVLSAWVQKCQNSERTAKALWGAEWPTNRRWGLRQLGDFEEHMKTIDTSLKYDEAQALSKQVGTAVEVVHKFYEDPLKVEDSDDFAHVLDEAMAFLNMPPTVASPFRSWLHADRHRRKISLAKNAAEFWQCISEACLAENGLGEEDRHPLQVSFIAEWMLRTNQSKMEVPTDLVMAPRRHQKKQNKGSQKRIFKK
jgi:hypothetical protein